jgi:hypothetical protein
MPRMQQAGRMQASSGSVALRTLLACACVEVFKFVILNYDIFLHRVEVTLVFSPS